MATEAPEVSVVVPACDRRLRLLWLLNALEEQTLPAAQWEVVVSDQSRDPGVRAVLEDHPLTRSGRLRHVRAPDTRRGAAANRNVGWKQARGALVAFIDDDCRPEPRWLEEIVVAARANPGQVIQGSTRPDPDEAHLLASVPYARSLAVQPPEITAPTANIAYPRELLEALGGFDEEAFGHLGGEDTDLFLRAVAHGRRLVAAPGAVVLHAVHPKTIVGQLRAFARWRALPLVVKRHPRMRRRLPLGLFLRWRHALFMLALAGVAASFRRRLLLAAALPWMAAAVPRLGVRRTPRAVLALPARAAVDCVEVGVLAAGSVRHRTVLL